MPVDADGFFHPLRTPSGIVATDFVPGDHKHHRGLFQAWVELHGARDADFWDRGGRAPIKDRRIVKRSLEGAAEGFVARNDWMAAGSVTIEEKLEATSLELEGLNVLHPRPWATKVLFGTVGRDGYHVELHGGGILRLRLDGTGLEEVVGLISRAACSPGVG